MGSTHTHLPVDPDHEPAVAATQLAREQVAAAEPVTALALDDPLG
jgi:hypothetical protein